MEPLKPMEETRAWYNRISGVYDLLEGRYEKAAIEAGLRLLDVQPGERVLEIGFGPGHALVSLAGSVGTEGQVSGVDISDEMYKMAKDAVERAGFTGRVVLIRGDARTLPFTDGFFDAVFMSFTFELFSDADIPVLLGECRRVIGEGGRLCVVSLLKTESPGIAGWIYDRLHELFPGHIDCRPIALPELLGGAGFTVSRAEESSLWGLAVGIALCRIS
jgi:ubiquinone/menaquinone biosynthesis C-methylase UbiE